MSNLQFVATRNSTGRPVGALRTGGTVEFKPATFTAAECAEAIAQMNLFSTTASGVHKNGLFLGRTDATSSCKTFALVVRNAVGHFVAALDFDGDKFVFDGVPFFDFETRDRACKKAAPLLRQAEIFVEYKANGIDDEESMVFLNVAAEIVLNS